MKITLTLLAVLVTLFSVNAFAYPSISFDKASYHYGDSVKISGNVEYQQGMFVIIQVRSSSDIVAIAQLFPSSSGEFSSTFTAEGPKWQESGTYNVMVTYAGQKVEKTFQFSKAQKNPTDKTQTEQESPLEKPKVVIKGFPDPAKSPQYYYDRYNNEPEFKRWFDSVFSGYAIQEIVGYKATHVPGFPDPNHPPQYYIDRYNNEDPFREWFDQQFPEKTIYDVVGVTEQTRMIAPAWVRQHAQMWSSGEIDDKRFIEGIADLIRQNMIEINEDITNQDSLDKTIPSWFKRIASWYSQSLITDDDFLSGIQYLIENEIMVV